MNTTLLFFNLGGGEIFVILLIVILLFGSKKIPELARGLGKGIREFKSATSDIQREIESTSKDIAKEANKLKDGTDINKFINKED